MRGSEDSISSGSERVSEKPGWKEVLMGTLKKMKSGCINYRGTVLGVNLESYMVGV